MGTAGTPDTASAYPENGYQTWTTNGYRDHFEGKYSNLQRQGHPPAVARKNGNRIVLAMLRKSEVLILKNGFNNAGIFYLASF